MKKVISILLTAIMLLSLVPMSTIAEALNTAKLTVETVDSTPGDTVDIAVKLENNPGIVSMSITVSFDDGLTLIGATNGNTFPATMAFTPPNQLKTVGKINGSCNFMWSGTDIDDDDIKDGVILTLKFKVSDDAEIGDVYNIVVSSNPSGVVDRNLQPIDLSYSQGKVSIIDYTPGDVNDDGQITALDTVMISRYIVDGCTYDPDGYAIRLNSKAADVNGDGIISVMDVVMISRYIVDGCKTDPDGYNIKFVTTGKICDHELTTFAAKPATCTENGNIAYWYCSKCKKYFSNAGATSVITLENTVIEAKGHAVVIDPAVPATYETTGLTEGSHCSVCQAVIVAQEIIPMLQHEQYSITYDIANGDTYLASLDIENPNPSYYATEEGVSSFKNLSVPGYKFIGWYDLPSGGNAVNVKSIPVGEKKNYQLYAHWEEISYNITYKLYHTPLGQITDNKYLTYTISKGLVDLPNPTINNYVFLGWYIGSGENAKEVDNIPIGTTGDITLNAHWTSKRNLAKKVSVLDDPIICEDSDNGTIYFAYEIGTIENVPLSDEPIWRIQTVAGLSQQQSETVTTTISKTKAEAITNTISKATVDSASWTLSENWNNSTSVTQQWAEEHGMTVEEANELVKTSSGTFAFTTADGGVHTETTTDGTTAVTYDSVNYTHGNSAEIGVNVKDTFTRELKAGGKIDVLDLGASVKNELSIGIEGKYKQQKETNEHTGTDTTKIDSTVKNDSTTWNTSSTSSATKSASERASVSQALSEKISSSKNYGSTYSKGGSNSEAQAFSTTESTDISTSSTFTYFESETITKTSTYSTDGKSEGCYRLVLAGTVHVFAVVGYDVATKSYFTYTYNVLDDKTYEFLDYAPDLSFSDCQYGVLPFEIPYFVHEYVENAISCTEGISYQTNSANKTAIVSKYVGTDTDVTIPTYVSISGTSYKVIGISATAFAGKDVEAISIGKYVEEIPDGAFMNCNKLKQISGYFTKIGKNAFSGCGSLENFNISSNITYIGENAFRGVDNVFISVINAYSAIEKVANDNSKNENETDEAYLERLEIVARELTQVIACQVLESGANNIVLDVSKVIDGVIFTLNVPYIESFKLLGKKRTFSDIQLVSNAKTTEIDEIIVKDCSRVPFKVSSEKLILDAIYVEANAFAMVLLADNTIVSLKRDNTFKSLKGNCIVGKSITADPITIESAEGMLYVDGNVYVYGKLYNEENVVITNGSIIEIDSDLYEKYIKGTFSLKFDANGGSTSTDNKTVYSGFEIGELPLPVRNYYTFNGWFTAAEGGTEVTSETVMTSTEDITVYAHWTIKPEEGWVKASELPSGAQVTQRKYTYTHRYYTTSSSSSMSGWTKYDTKRTGWGSTQGPVYSDPSNGSRNVWSEQYIVSSKTVYNYYRYCYGGYWDSGSYYSYQSQPGGANYYTYTSYSEMPYKSESQTGGVAGYGFTKPSGGWILVWKCPTYTTQENTYGTRWYYQEPVYTYYYYQDKNEESATRPSGSEYSNIVEWVKFRRK